MKKHKGFTLIELLVVIAIIGILATIVLVSLNAARDNARDGVVKTQVTQMKNIAEIAFSNDGNYNNTCDATAGSDWILIRDEAAANNGGTNPVCVDTDDDWCVEAVLNNGTDYFCVDSSPFAGVLTGAARDACAGATCAL